MSLAALLTRQRVTAYALLLALGYLVLVVMLNLMAEQQVRDRVGVLATDYTGFHAGALVLAEGPPAAVFDIARLTAAQGRALDSRYGADLAPEQRDKARLFHWRYPPPIFFLVRPLAELPAVVGYYLWGFALLAPLLLAAWLIQPGALGPALALAMPATFVTFMFGQNGALTAGLIGLGLVLAERRPWAAGLAIGLLCYKPQFGLLLPFVLLAAGRWRVMASAAATVAAVVLASILVFGVEPWLAFLESMGRSGGHLAEGDVAWTVMPTPFAMLRLWLPADAAMAGQMAASVVTVAAVAWIWRRREAAAAPRKAAVCLGALLAVPFAFVYDLAIVTPALLWLGQDLHQRGGRPWQWLLLVAVALLPFYAGGLAKVTGVQTAPLVLAAALAMTIGRGRASCCSSCHWK